MDHAKDEIEKEAEKKKIIIHEGTGPAFDVPVEKNIHENN
jgi:hypothetical protein